jgi:hypothetical protein
MKFTLHKAAFIPRSAPTYFFAPAQSAYCLKTNLAVSQVASRHERLAFFETGTKTQSKWGSTWEVAKMAVYMLHTF